MARLFCGLALAFGLFGTAAHGQDVTLTVVSWNVESGGSDVNTISQQIAAAQGVDLSGLSEVQGESAAQAFETAAGEGEQGSFDAVVGTTGGADRLVILFNTTRLKLLRSEELHQMNPQGKVRSPLVALFEGVTTKQRFYFMVNHLYRSNASARHAQAKQLNRWGAKQNHPVIAVGDYNFDWDAEGGEAHHDLGYDHMVADGVFNWVRPAQLVPTQASEHESVLDFVFTAGEAAGWRAESTIVVQPGDFPDDAKTSDHRPVRAVFTQGSQRGPQPLAAGSVTKAEILARIARMEEELKTLKALAGDLPD